MRSTCTSPTDSSTHPTSVATGVVAAAGVAVALRGARRELDDRTAPMAGLVATFVFAGQMINFPVAAGTSGHLLGGALAAVLVGPYTGALCISVVLLVQALLMADGGITALGTNVTLMGLVGVGAGWLVFAALRARAAQEPRHGRPGRGRRRAVCVPVAALVFTVLFVVGGTAPVEIGTVLTAMLGWHTVIGIGEAVITVLVVGTVVAARPDLVYGARPLLAARELEIRKDAGGRPMTPQHQVLRVGFLLVALLIAGVGSYYASAHPDGLTTSPSRPASSTPRGVRDGRRPLRRLRAPGHRQRTAQRRRRRRRRRR